MQVDEIYIQYIYILITIDVKKRGATQDVPQISINKIGAIYRCYLYPK